MSYLAPPAKPGPGLILIHEWWGLNDHIRSVADRYAAAGFLTLAVDLYDGKTARTPDEAKALLSGLAEPGVKAALEAAAAELKDNPSFTGTFPGVLGFCMGGRLALFAGCEVNGINAVVDFYGGANPPFALDLKKMQAPVLGCFGAQDKSILPQAIEALREGLSTFKKHIDVAVYPDAGHAFFNDTRPEMFHAASAEDAFERSVTFLRRYLAR